MYSLLIDPGASKGVIGLNNPKGVIREVLEPQGCHGQVVRSKSHKTFTGISSTQQKSVDLCRFPIGLAGEKNATFTADVLDGQGADCPGPIPLDGLVAQGGIIMCGYLL